jgi:hypothetical protein
MTNISEFSQVGITIGGGFFAGAFFPRERVKEQ